MLEPVPVGAGAGLRVLRGLALPLGLAPRVGGGLPPRRCGSTETCGIVCAGALAVAAAASSTVRRILGVSAAAAAASAAACMAAAFALSTRLCRRTVGLITIAGSVPTVAEELVALARWSPPKSLARVLCFMGLSGGSRFTA